MGLGDKMFRGALWSGLERISIQFIQFLIGLVLARLLTPNEYGTIGLIIVFITISKVFVDSGFTKALIQKKDRTEDDISTVFIFNIAISIVCYALLWFASPFVARFYDVPILSSLLKVLSASLVLNALFSVPGTLFSIKMDFKAITKINLVASLTSGIIAIILAYIGFGIWALVWQTLIRSLVAATLTWSLIKWRPNWIFSKKSFKDMFSYGYKLLISSLMSTFFSNLNALLIGKYIGTKELGLYSRGIQFSDLVFNIFNASLNNILLPGLAPYQDNRNLLVLHIRKILKTSMIITLPIFLGLSVLAEPLIRVLLTDKWILAAPIMQIFCISRLITIMSGININLLYIIGRTDLVLKQEYFKIVIRIILLLIALKYGILYIALAELLTTCIHFFINTYFPGKIIEFGAWKQLFDLWRIILSGIIMSVVIYIVQLYLVNDIIILTTTPIIGITTYYFSLNLLNEKDLKSLLKKIKLLVVR
ncbi:lipopolysaccharide biosynthesis protein [Maribacter litoralis]|uniref:lipopolysaccharide biosynthesis protein n=1 Tax=Maribacter litoralis TaxID=2059726 RepID=UPI003F5CE345